MKFKVCMLAAVLAGACGQLSARGPGIVSNASGDADTEGAAQGMLLRSTPSPEALPRIALPNSPSVSEAARVAVSRVESEAPNPVPFTYRENKRVRPEQHAFFDKRNMWLTVATVGGQTLDAFTTRYTLDHYSNVKEGSPFARPFENQGWAGTIGFHYGINAGGTLLCQYLAHRRGHHKLERWIPVITIGQSLQGSLMNFRAQSQAILKR